VPVEDLWKGMTSVSNAGKKRGRGKEARRTMAPDLNRGQIIGVGKEKI
jgi:small subunit ribosomal protein S5